MWTVTKYGVAFIAGQAFQILSDQRTFRRDVERAFEQMQVVNRARVDFMRKLRDDDA